jgi:hypothetical protein
MFSDCSDLVSFIIGLWLAPAIYYILFLIIYSLTGYPRIHIFENKNSNDTSNKNENDVNENFVNLNFNKESKTD